MSDPNRAAQKAALHAMRAKKYAEYIEGLSHNFIEFTPFPKMARLNREVIITEKIDGTNAAIRVVTEVPEVMDGGVLFTRQLDRPIVVAQSRTRILTPEQDNFGFAAWVEKHEQSLAEKLGPGLHFGEWWGDGIQRGYGLVGDRWFSLFNTYKWILHEGQPYEYDGEQAIHEGPDEMHPAILDLRDMGVNITTVPILYRGSLVAGAGFVNEQEERLIPLEELIKRGIEGEFDYDEIMKLAKDAARSRFMPHLICEMLKRGGSQAVPGFNKPEGIVVFHLASGSSFKMTIEGDETRKGA